MRRRDFMTLVAGASTVAWPFTADAQQAGKVAKIGYLSSNLANQGPLKLSVRDCVISVMSRAVTS